MVQKSKIHVIYSISQNLSLQMEFFPDTVRKTSSDVRGKLSLKFTATGGTTLHAGLGREIY